MTTARQLYELQEIDLDLARKREALERVEAELGRDEALVAARADLDLEKQRLAQLRRDERDAELGVGGLSAKIAQEEQKLYGGSVRSPRELLSMQEEVGHLRAHKGREEERLLDIMDKVEAAQGEVRDRARALEKMEGDWRQEQERLAREQADLKADLAALERRRAQAAGEVAQAALSLYEHLVVEKQGQAIARAEQGRCQGCRIGLPMSDLQRARIGQELVRCSNCGRILFVS